MFAEMLKTSTNITKVEAKHRDANKDSEHALTFQEVIEFHTDHKSSQMKKQKHAVERMRSCDTDAMFEQMHDYLENKSKNEKMPVRKFFNNSFGQILNDAIFALKKKQLKSTGEEASKLQHAEAQIKFVAMYILKKLPEGELHGQGDLGDAHDEQ